VQGPGAECAPLGKEGLYYKSKQKRKRWYYNIIHYQRRKGERHNKSQTTKGRVRAPAK